MTTRRIGEPVDSGRNPSNPRSHASRAAPAVRRRSRRSLAATRRWPATSRLLEKVLAVVQPAARWPCSATSSAARSSRLLAGGRESPRQPSGRRWRPESFPRHRRAASRVPSWDRALTCEPVSDRSSSATSSIVAFSSELNRSHRVCHEPATDGAGSRGHRTRRSARLGHPARASSAPGQAGAEPVLARASGTRPR